MTRKHGLDACVGYIKYIEVSEKYIGFDYKLTGQTIAFDDLMKLGELFGIDEWEWNRTHCTMKEIDLEMLEPYLRGKDVSKPEIFVLYNRTSPEHRQKVEAVIDRLEKEGINVRYYENVLRPGENTNFSQ